jgi:hypothetical protein
MNEKLRIFRLTTGEEVVGEIEEETDSHIKVKNPCNLGITVTQTGKPSLSMQPLLLFSEQKVVTFKKEHVMYDTSVAIEIQNKYNEAYGSGIVVAKNTKIVT